MNLNKPPKSALSTLVRKALINRYNFTRVTIDRLGEVTAYNESRDRWGPMSSTHSFGNLSMWSWKRSDSMGILLYFQRNAEVPATLMFKFGPDN